AGEWRSGGRVGPRRGRAGGRHPGWEPSGGKAGSAAAPRSALRLTLGRLPEHLLEVYVLVQLLALAGAGASDRMPERVGQRPPCDAALDALVIILTGLAVARWPCGSLAFAGSGGARGRTRRS